MLSQSEAKHDIEHKRKSVWK